MAKVFNDPIHGHIELHPLLVRIIDTPEFQRLRYIKQLGGGYFVYPGASHNRFEHSIGVAYLAGKLAEALKSKQSKELDEIEERLKEEETEKLKSRQADLKKSLISDRDVLCVQIAGLCHDLGHGPFSHVFDRMFNPEADPEHEDWKHEDASEAMFDYLVTNRLKEDKEVKKLLPADLTFIKEMINPKKPRDCGHQREEKSFLYEIVSNEQNGIDVDKFDYFARDCHHLGIKNNFDHQRFIMFARVCEVNEWKHICSREKEVANLYDMFHTRNSLHRRAYQHRVTKSVEIMIKDALLKADKHIQFKSSTGEMLPLSQAKNDMEAYSKLTDQVLEEIYKSTSNSLMEAREIIQRIMTRKLYWFVGQAKPKKDQEKISKEKKESLKRKLEEDMPGMKFEVIVVTMDYGMKDKDPINNTYFYRKNEPNKGFTIPKSKVSKLLPECFSEEILRVYLKNHEDEHVKKAEAQTHFKDWCNKNDFEVDREDDDDDASAASCAAAGTEK